MFHTSRLYFCAGPCWTIDLVPFALCRLTRTRSRVCSCASFCWRLRWSYSSACLRSKCLEPLQDVESEAAVSGALRALMRGRTTLLIAHRLSTVRQASRIVVVKAGRVVEQGSHQQLMRLRDGVYAGMIRQAESSAAETVDASIDEPGVLCPACIIVRA